MFIINNLIIRFLISNSAYKFKSLKIGKLNSKFFFYKYLFKFYVDYHKLYFIKIYLSKELDPLNPKLQLNYLKAHGIHYIKLCEPG